MPNGEVRKALVWADADKSGGPLVIYWHSTTHAPSEASQGVGDDVIAEVRRLGGMVVAPFSSIKSGIPWGLKSNSPDDFFADQIVACAREKKQIDPLRIHMIGYSAGALQSGKLSIIRSNYVSSIVMYSGGIVPSYKYRFNGSDAHVAALAFYGGPSDNVLVPFELTTWDYWSFLKNHSDAHYVTVCNHKGGHQILPGVSQAAWDFLVAYPFNSSNPYSSQTPETFPQVCLDTPQVPPNRTESDSPFNCAAGTYFSFSSKRCEACPSFSTSEYGSNSIDQCTCLPGYTGPNGSNCTACPVYKYKDTPGSGECLACPFFSYSPAASASLEACICVGGHTGPNGGPCEACPADTYKDTAGPGECKACPSHSSSLPGSFSRNFCDCNRGFIGISGDRCFASGYVVLVVLLPIALGIATFFGVRAYLRKREVRAKKLKEQADFNGMFDGQEDYFDDEAINPEGLPSSSRSKENFQAIPMS